MSTKPKLPPDAVQFAKKMGIDLDGLEPEAQAIWAQLEQMSSTDPLQYERFVAEQMQQAKEEEEAAKGKKNEKDRSFRPDVGYVFRVNTEGGDGSIIRELNALKALYVNVCHSKVIEAPLDQEGRKVTGDLAYSNGPQIPLLVGPVRTVDENSNAIDVVVNPMVVDCCKKHKEFKIQLTDLALQWIVEETSLKIIPNTVQDEETVTYYGGLGDDKDIPILFHVTKEMIEGQQAQGKKKETDSVLSSTSSLLSHIKKDDEETAIKEAIKIGKASEVKKTVQKKEEEKPATTTITNAKKIIEEIGVKVFETGTKQAETKDVATKVGTRKVNQVEPNKLEYEAMERMLEQNDEEFGSNQRSIFYQNKTMQDESVDLISKLAGAFTRSQPGLNLSANEASNSTSVNSSSMSKFDVNVGNESGSVLRSFQVFNKNPTLCPVSLQWQADNRLVIIIENLKKDVSTRSMDMQAGSNEMKIDLDLNLFENSKNEGRESIRLICSEKGLSFDPNQIKAKLHKKLKKLEVSVGFKAV